MSFRSPAPRDFSFRLTGLIAFTFTSLALLAAFSLPAAAVDNNNPGIMEPVSTAVQGREIRIPNTDQSVDGNEKSTIHGPIVYEQATETTSILGHTITRVSSPNDDMRLALADILAKAVDRDSDGMRAGARELRDILLGTTQGRIYDGFAMLNYNRGAYVHDHIAGEYKMKVATDTGETALNPYDPEGGNAKIWEVDINMLYYDGQIDSDTYLLRFPFGVGVVGLPGQDDTVRVNYRIYSLVREDFSPTLAALDRRQALNSVQFPYKAFDSVWVAFEPGQVTNLTVEYPPAGQVRGVYTWGWREHPPRIQFLQPVYEIQNQNTGEIELGPQGNSYATRNRENLTLDNIGDAAPEKKMFQLAQAVLLGASPQAIERWMTRRNRGPEGTWIEWADLVKNQTQLPGEAWEVLEAEGIARGGFGDYDMVSVFLNNEMYGDGPFLNEIRQWNQGDTFKIKLINLDNHTHYFRNVDFGPRLNDDIQNCCGGGETSFEVLNFKGTYGIPKVAEMQWRAGWGFRPHYDVIQQSEVFSRGQDRVKLKPFTGGEGGTFYGYQWSEAARQGDFRFNPPEFIIGFDAADPSSQRLKGADGDEGFVIGQFTEGFGVGQMCPNDPAGFCSNDISAYNPNGALNRDSDGDGINDVLLFPPFLRNPAQGQEGAGDIIPPTGAWRPFLWTNPNNGTLYIDPDDPSQGYWADLTYAHGRPVTAGQAVSANIELPRSSGQVFYQFDDLFHDNSIFSPHPVAASTGSGSDNESDAVERLVAFRDGPLKVRGTVSQLSFGEYANWITLYNGTAGEEGCTGTALTSGPVRQSDGFFLFRCGATGCSSPLGQTLVSSGVPGSTVCVQTNVGAFREVNIEN
ncbi:MAG: hypothetical protein K0U98_26090 [Deltaproteobacteria bacterium]|nr:hypothetical protein [Deltaproteobacteria bacterium]